jgi:hypothetical protein
MRSASIRCDLLYHRTMKQLLLVLIAMISIHGSLLAQTKKTNGDEWTARVMHAGIDDLASLRFAMPIGGKWFGGLSAFYRLNTDAQTWTDDGHQEYRYMFYAYAQTEVAKISLADKLDLVTNFSTGFGVAMKRETFCEDVVEHVPVLLVEPTLMMRWKMTTKMTLNGGFSLFHSPTFDKAALTSLPKGTVSIAMSLGM